MTCYWINEHVERSTAMFHVLSFTTCKTKSPVSPISHWCAELRVMGLGLGCFIIKEKRTYDAP